MLRLATIRFAEWGPWDRVHSHPLLRHHETGDAAREPRFQIGTVSRAAVNRNDTTSPKLVFNTNHHDVIYRCMLHQLRLHALRVDVLTAGDNHDVGTAQDRHRSLIIDLSEVTGHEPRVTAIRLAQVSRRDLIRSKCDAPIVPDPQLDSGKRMRSSTQSGSGPERGHLPKRLGHAVAGQNRQPSSRRPFEQSIGNRATADKHSAQAVEGPGIVIEDSVQHCGNDGHNRAPSPHLSGEAGRVEPREQSHPSAGICTSHDG